MPGKIFHQVAALLMGCSMTGSAFSEPVWNDDKGGATRDYYHKAAGLEWDRELGDWLDADGKPWGDNPYDALRIAPADEGETVSFDVTALVSKWLTGEENQGFYLKSENGIVKLQSREGKQKKPVLFVQFADGLAKKYAIFDTSLDKSTSSSLGKTGSLKVAGNSRVLLWFDLGDLTLKKRLQSARLLLHTDKVYGDGALVQVFEASPAPRSSHERSREYGLARDYPMDRGVADSPAVYYAEGFDGSSWEGGEPRKWLSEGRSGVVVDSAPEGAYKPLSGKALRVKLPKGQNTALNQNYRFRGRGHEEPREAYFRYYVRLADDWNQTASGGKLPGFAGTYGRAGWGGRKANGTNGWSARGAFEKSYETYNGTRVTPVGNYVYHAGQPGYYGDVWIWNESGGGLLKNNRWYCIEQYVKLNDPGENNGVLRAWLDGRRVFNKEKLRFRDTADLKIEEVWFNVYHGGATKSPRDQHLYIDNVIIAREYIGPMKREAKD
jgi:hypothetical protein